MDIPDFIAKAVEISNLIDYKSSYEELGGGELNQTYLLQCHTRKVVLRVSRYPDHTSLIREARALSALIDVAYVPNLIFFDENSRVDGLLWILEEYVPGEQCDRLNIEQLYSLGKLLASVHSAGTSKETTTPWKMLIKNCKGFGSEDYLLHHPDPQLADCFNEVKRLCERYSQPDITVLAHCDITPSNTLVAGKNVRLIDWEFASHRHPMAEFSTGYYRDMELNNGKWRQRLSDEEYDSLLGGYESDGSIVDRDLLALYEIVDKVGVAAYLYWRLHVSDWEARDGMEQQYYIDYERIVSSIKNQLR